MDFCLVGEKINEFHHRWKKECHSSKYHNFHQDRKKSQYSTTVGKVTIFHFGWNTNLKNYWMLIYHQDMLPLMQIEILMTVGLITICMNEGSIWQRIASDSTEWFWIMYTKTNGDTFCDGSMFSMRTSKGLRSSFGHSIFNRPYYVFCFYKLWWLMAVKFKKIQQ